MSVLRCPYAKASAPHTYDAVKLEHDPEKWVPVFGKDHAQQSSRAG
jgi:hypothetical protein